MNLIITLISSLVASVIEAYFDSRKWIKGKTIKHALSFFWRMVIGNGLVIFLSLSSHQVIWYHHIIEMVLLSSIACIQYWITFDISINLFKGMPLNYIGKTSAFDKNSTPETIYIKFVSYVMFLVFNLLFIYG